MSPESQSPLDVNQLLAFDPGGENIGVAVFEAGNCVEQRVIKGRKDFYAWLIDQPVPDVVVVEDFKIFPHMSQKLIFNGLQVVRCIGAIEKYCYDNDVPMIEQMSSIKTTGYMWAGLKNRHKHEEDAYVHGLYYLIKNGHRRIPRRTSSMG